MRAICLLPLLLAAGGCASDTLDNVTYRRLVDQFDSYDQCLSEGDFAPCYQSLTFCVDGRANANLEFRQEGPYHVEDDVAIAHLQTVTVNFDLETASAPELPGRHPWELVEPLNFDCAR